MPDTSEALDWRGRTAVGADGSKLGKIEEIYLDSDTEQPEWALVNTGLFGGKSSFMPLRDASSDGDEVTAPYSKAQVKDAPRIDVDDALSQREESTLYAHYGIEYGESRSGSALPEADTERPGEVGRDVSGPETDDAMTRSEEELTVGTTQRESGRVRLRKYIVTEEVQQTVPVRREEIRIEREPITDANRDEAVSGGELTEEEHEVTLYEEQAVVEKKVVPKERVRLDKDVTQSEETVSETIRKEQIETDGAPDRR